MLGMWRGVKDGKDLIAMPRAAFLRMLLFSHWIQHRGQLSVYLRLLGEKVPSSDGPSADERPDFMKPASWRRMKRCSRVSGAFYPLSSSTVAAHKDELKNR
ncbi:MAG: hypothetical protein HYS05_03170 [Acidobacteria bacterium]|nr:hypothetical protein [Acidobacteriota bacterium]